MVCPSCKANNPDTVRFCGQCGRGLVIADEAQTILLDGPAAAAPASAIVPQAAGVLSPPPDFGQAVTWGPAVPRMGNASFAPGSTFASRYRIEGVLGEGGMGTVYKAYDTELDRYVALKLVRPELSTSRETMQRFKQELLLASRISHKNVLRIHDLGDSNGVKFISMAFVEGVDLAGLMDQEGALPVERTLKFTRQLCGALEAAHHEGVVHRDLKPQNILIDRSDNIYVSDFGLAKSLEATTSLMTRTGQLLGTPRYMSPEQVQAKDVDRRSDLYSLGLILYEMLTSQMPFRGESAMQLMYQRVNEPPRDPRAERPDLPDYLARVILKCLERDPARRYQDAHEILADLDRQNVPSAAPPAASRPADQTINIQIPKPAARWGAVAACAVLVVGLVVALPSTRHWIFGPRTQSATTAKPSHYLAVLPLSVVGDSALQYVADGVVDAVSAKLAGLREVYVASGNSVAEALSRKDPPRIAHALGVTLLVSGTMQSSADKVSITITLDDFAKGARTLLHREFAGDRRDLLTVEDNIFNSLVNALLIQQSNEELARTRTRPTQDYDAYDLYLRGRNLLRGKQDANTIQNALDLFDKAIHADPTFALAFAGAADGDLMMYDLTKDSVWTNKALGAAQQAQRLNDSLPEVHFSLGSINNDMGKPEEAIAELQRALRLAPNSDEGLRRLGEAYRAAGQQQKGIDELVRATQINPYLWTNYNLLGRAYYLYGKNEQALQAFEKVRELEPDRPNGWANVGAVYYRLGQWSNCIPAFQKAIELQPKPVYYSQLGVAYFFTGKYAESVKWFEKAVAGNPNDASFRVNLADGYRWSGQTGKARAAYNSAIQLANKILDVNPRDAVALGNTAIAYAKTGDLPDAAKFIQQARQVDRQNVDLMYQEATIHALAGRTADAIASLGEALRSGCPIEEAQNDPELAGLRKAHEFDALLRQVEQKKPQ